MPEGIARICNAAIGPKARFRVPKSLRRRTGFHAEAKARVSVLLRPRVMPSVSNPGLYRGGMLKGRECQQTLEQPEMVG